jgi:hypothetical protein
MLVLAALLAALQGAATAQGTFGETVRAARLQLDIGNPGRAAALYEKAVAMRPSSVAGLAPERAWAYLRLGNDALHDDQLEEAEASFTLVAALAPDFKDLVLPQWIYVRLTRINATITQAIQEESEADWGSLQRELRWVIDVSPGNKRALYLLAIIAEATGERERARRLYAELLGDVPQDNSLERLRKSAHRAVGRTHIQFGMRPVYPPWLIGDNGPFKTYRSPPFVIYHHNGDLAGRIAAVLDYHLGKTALEGVLEDNGPFVEECAVYIFADEVAFREAGGSEVWAGGQARGTTRNGELVHAQIHLYQNVPELTESAVPHELAHVRLLAAAPSARDLPLWIQEGVASSQESTYKKEILAQAVLAAVQEGTAISFEDLMAAETYPKNASGELFYGECAGAVESLVEAYGRDRFWRFIVATAKVGPTEALEEVYGLSPHHVEDLIRDWAAARQ